VRRRCHRLHRRHAIPATRQVSDITARPVHAEATTPEFWIRELRDPVRFADAVGRLHGDGAPAMCRDWPAVHRGAEVSGALDGGAG